jgi:hypothetical protein
MSLVSVFVAVPGDKNVNSGFIYIDTQGTDSLLEEERKTKLKGFMETDRQKL